MESGERRERWRTRGTLAGLRLSVPGGRRDVFEALRDGGPTNSAGAGSRLIDALVVLFLLSDILEVVRVVVALDHKVCPTVMKNK